ncbi:MAG: ATP-binding protein [Eubacteriales bacterium]|nr:ATP-binding protein [Eubacteriales bacterium]
MKQITVPAKLEKLSAVRAFVEDALTKTESSAKARMQLSLAAEEAFVNIARYAYGKESGNVSISIAITGVPPQATLVFSDRGIPHNPLRKPDPDTSLPAEHRAVGGLGIYMMKQSVDDAQYCYQDGQNRLTLVKKLG